MATNTEWLNAPEKCFECDASCPRKDLRYYDIGDYADFNSFICKGCWDITAETVDDEDLVVWPEQLIRRNETKLQKGKLYQNDKCVGTVSDYNGSTGFVTLFEYPNASEYGIVGTEYRFEADE